MNTLLQFPQEDCPIPIKEQIITLMRREWPQAFECMGENILWPSNPEIHPTSLVLIENHIVISHIAVSWKYIKHQGQTYKVFGLSEVMTNPSYRNQGFGLKLVKEAVSFIEKNDPDIGIFTCKPPLVYFYNQGGWEHIKNTNLIGGTRNKPFRSDSLGLSTMIRFFSNKAQQNRPAFEETDVYLELGEKMLW
ncbi:GNAT family N-acetyltransferase [Brevibacillus laterosporus]|uniref:GNAT family N-acetyltransferase n=1 Tax=Brevibacillus laterosporus TaxID=1465 RepID=A0A502HF89_BRELA|nr:GNAT family N-acetyltransferase [Brevibacillus laterosporus]QDX93484.1 GNAT family N-acetyltransferase [Brevibacillus laterosporus]TPG73231.1 GNAT family N-acetyltransferase [Brevibacillus laterosporus]TPG88976.1 GNAT family N-acetyltransferase [Brevibacillus laterosporus]